MLGSSMQPLPAEAGMLAGMAFASTGTKEGKVQVHRWILPVVPAIHNRIKAP